MVTIYVSTRKKSNVLMKWYNLHYQNHLQNKLNKNDLS